MQPQNALWFLKSFQHAKRTREQFLKSLKRVILMTENLEQDFKQAYSHEGICRVIEFSLSVFWLLERCEVAQKILLKFPDRIPVCQICCSVASNFEGRRRTSQANALRHSVLHKEEVSSSTVEQFGIFHVRSAQASPIVASCMFRSVWNCYYLFADRIGKSYFLVYRQRDAFAKYVRKSLFCCSFELVLWLWFVDSFGYFLCF
jgi:hypothetical protein